MNGRNWKDMQNDEIYAIWSGYLHSDGFMSFDILKCGVNRKPIRLTPIEIIKLVDELLDRLEIKESKEDNNHE